MPAAVALAVWGLVTGVAMVQSGLSSGQAVAMSFMVYAGSAQLASLPLFAAAAPLPIIWASAFIINLRFVIYSVAFKPFFRPLSFVRRIIYGSAAVDAMAAEFFNRFVEPGKRHQLIEEKSIDAFAYFRTGSALCWVVWQAASIAGIFLSAWIPADWGLDFVATLALIVMVAPMVMDRAALACVLTAAVIALLTYKLPLNLGLLLSVLGGVAAAIALDRPAEKTASKS